MEIMHHIANPKFGTFYIAREYCVLNRRWADKNAYHGAVGLFKIGHLSVDDRIFKELVFYKLLIMFLNLIFFIFPAL